MIGTVVMVRVVHPAALRHPAAPRPHAAAARDSCAVHEFAAAPYTNFPRRRTRIFRGAVREFCAAPYTNFPRRRTRILRAAVHEFSRPGGGAERGERAEHDSCAAGRACAAVRRGDGCGGWGREAAGTAAERPERPRRRLGGREAAGRESRGAAAPRPVRRRECVAQKKGLDAPPRRTFKNIRTMLRAAALEAVRPPGRPLRWYGRPCPYF